MDYINRTYNDDLVHTGCKDIYIVNAIFTIDEGEGCDFGAALDALKDGCRVTRAGWNGKGQYIELAENISYQNRCGEIINCDHENIGNKAIAFVGTSGVQMGWLASQADMLADDWIILDEPEILCDAGESAGQYGDAPTLMPAALQEGGDPLISHLWVKQKPRFDHIRVFRLQADKTQARSIKREYGDRGRPEGRPNSFSDN